MDSQSNTNQEELDFNSDDYNSFYYTNEKQIKRMDDQFILSKITEVYPDFSKDSSENLLKQVLLVIFNDGLLVRDLYTQYDVSPSELFKTIYRNYDFVFNKCFILRVQKIICNKSYAKLTRRKGKSFKSARKSCRDARKSPGKPRKKTGSNI